MDEWRWRDDAACLDADKRLFFTPDHREAAWQKELRERRAGAICAPCPVRQACLNYAIEKSMVGFWGGMTLEQRQAERRRRQRRAQQGRAAA